MTPQLTALRVLAVLITNVFLLAFVNRRHESDCDLFALNLQGHLDGASGYLNHYAGLNNGRRAHVLTRLVSTHPTPLDRLRKLNKSIAEQGQRVSEDN